MYKSSFFRKAEYKLGKFAIPNLMAVIVGAMALVYILDLMFLNRLGDTLSSHFVFDRAAILSGQIWRIITFALIPPDRSIIFIIFSLYFFWMMGSALENEWGAFRFNIFYLCGIVGTIIAGLIAGSVTNLYLNLSLFFAFALFYPEFELMLFFVLPVKIKYLAIADLVLFGYSFAVGSMADRVAILVAFSNIALFFGADFIAQIKKWKRNRDIKKRFKK